MVLTKRWGLRFDCLIRFADLEFPYSSKRRSMSLRSSTLVLYNATDVYSNVHKQVAQYSYTLCK